LLVVVLVVLLDLYDDSTAEIRADDLVVFVKVGQVEVGDRASAAHSIQPFLGSESPALDEEASDASIFVKKS